jgi:hypothetical protein
VCIELRSVTLSLSLQKLRHPILAPKWPRQLPTPDSVELGISLQPSPVQAPRDRRTCMKSSLTALGGAARNTNEGTGNQAARPAGGPESFVPPAPVMCHWRGDRDQRTCVGSRCATRRSGLPDRLQARRRTRGTEGSRRGLFRTVWTNFLEGLEIPAPEVSAQPALASTSYVTGVSSPAPRISE